MKNLFVSIFLLSGLCLSAEGQSRFQILFSGGPAFTSEISYKNSTGHINTVMKGYVGLVYQGNSPFGFELKLSASPRPTSYLSNDESDVVETYSTSRIRLNNILAGANYYFEANKLKPFVGILAGATQAQTTETAPKSSITNFTWGVQAGTTLSIAPSIDLRLDAGCIFIPGVSNASSYFNVGADGGGFPEFVIGAPSKATITQWNFGFGVLVGIGKSKR